MMGRPARIFIAVLLYDGNSRPRYRTPTAFAQTDELRFASMSSTPGQTNPGSVVKMVSSFQQRMTDARANAHKAEEKGAAEDERPSYQAAEVEQRYDLLERKGWLTPLTTGGKWLSDQMPQRDASVANPSYISPSSLTQTGAEVPGMEFPSSASSSTVWPTVASSTPTSADALSTHSCK